MPGRRLTMLAVKLAALVALLWLATIFVQGFRERNRQLEAVEAALPGASAFLSSDAAYKDVRVQIEPLGRPSLWFEGHVATAGDLDRLQAELDKRYGASGYLFSVGVWSAAERGAVPESRPQTQPVPITDGVDHAEYDPERQVYTVSEHGLRGDGMGETEWGHH